MTCNQERCIEILKGYGGNFECICCQKPITFEQIENNEVLYIGGMTDDILHYICSKNMFKK